MFEPEPILNFVLGVTRETEVQRRLRQRTVPMPMAQMQISPDEAALLSFLVGLIGARRAIEVGTFTGYSALAVAAALQQDGTLICCDVSDEWTRVGKPFWRDAGVDDRIDLRLGPAIETLRGLLRDEAGMFDFAFIDADKREYETYYEMILPLLRPGGLMVLDNMLWSGKVADESVQDEETRVLRKLSHTIRDDERVDAALLTIRDGVTLVRKR